MPARLKCLFVRVSWRCFLAVTLRHLHDIQIGDVLLTTVEGRQLRLRRVARPNSEQAELLAGLSLTLPERICADRDITDAQEVPTHGADLLVS